MKESGITKGWFAIGLGLIVLGGVLYGAIALLGVGLLINQATIAAGATVWGVLLIPGLVGLGFLVLVAKVIVDRINSAEDDHYSKHVEK